MDAHIDLHGRLVTVSLEFFTVNTKLAEMALLASNDLTTAKEVTSGGLDLMQEIIMQEIITQKFKDIP